MPTGGGRYAQQQIAGGGGWQPADPGNLYAWWDFTDSATITIDTGIGAIEDKGPSNRDLVNTTDANQPTVAAASVNGYDTGAFVMANNHALIHPTKSAWRIHNASTEWTFVIGVKQTNTDGGWTRQGVFGNGNDNYAGGMALITSRTDNNTRIGCNTNGVNPVGDIATISTTWTGLGTWRVITCIIDADNGTAADRIKHAFNGGSLLTTNVATGTAPTATDANAYFAIGGFGASSTTGGSVGPSFWGEVAHLIVYNAALGTSDWQAARDFVNGYVTAF
jgi:hypothetical protein